MKKSNGARRISPAKTNGTAKTISTTTRRDLAVMEQMVRVKRRDVAELYMLKHSPERMFQRLAETCDERGRFEIDVKIKLYPFELMAIARKARHTGVTMREIIEDFLTGESDDFPGIIESLRQYENTILPEKV